MRAPTWAVYVDLHRGLGLTETGDAERGRELVASAERRGRELGMSRSFGELAES